MANGTSLTRRSLLASALPALAAASCNSTTASRKDPPPVDPALRTRFWEPHDRELLAKVGVLVGRAVLDAGAGRGDHAVLFAGLGAGRVVALDLDEERVARLRARCEAHPDTARIEARVGDIRSLPFEAATFDVSWSSHVLHFMPDPIAVARELARVTRPGGIVAVREDRSLMRFLPMDVGLSRPGLEERSRAAFDAWYARDRAERGRVPHGWLGVLRRAGLRDMRATSVLFELHSPLEDHQGEYLRGVLRHMGAEELSAEDRSALAALAERGGPHDACQRDDLHLVSVSSVYLGTA